MTIAKLTPLLKDLIIADIDILSYAAYQQYEQYIPPIHADWWLKSETRAAPGFAAIVSYDRNMIASPDCDKSGIRPCLQVTNLQELGLYPKDTIAFAGYQWTVISEDLILCGDIVREFHVRTGYTAKSIHLDVRNLLLKWAKDQHIDLPTPQNDEIIPAKKYPSPYPLPPIEVMDGFVPRFKCPICGTHLLSATYGRWDFCPKCGQEIDWDKPQT